MKKIILLIAFMGSAFALNAQQADTTKFDTSQMARIVFETTVHDYGTIAKDSDGTYLFKFTNKGKVPLLLSSVRSSCGCTTPTFPQEPIAPGKKGVITVKYNTVNTGQFTKSVTVYSNSITPVVVLQIKGEVK